MHNVKIKLRNSYISAGKPGYTHRDNLANNTGGGTKLNMGMTEESS
jgi:hypothetical protein